MSHAVFRRSPARLSAWCVVIPSYGRFPKSEFPAIAADQRDPTAMAMQLEHVVRQRDQAKLSAHLT
jgi:hypothetical protein